MKILLLGFAKIKYMPYVNFYLENIDKNEHEMHLLYWNRNLEEENVQNLENVRLHEFAFYLEDCQAKVKKIKAFCNYRRFAKKVIKEVQPDFIIVLHSLPGVLFYKTLGKEYSKKYIFDYRDSTYENFYFYKKIIHKIVKNSRATFVSSDAFRKFLPKNQSGKIYTSHNLLLDSLKHRNEKITHNVASERIRIGFWGFIREERLNREIIKKIAKDNRFELHYYGREQQTVLNLKSYAKEISATNIFFHGEYSPNDRYQFVKKTDIIHNVYEDNNMMLAMSNKYYDGMFFRIPQICMKGSYMGQKIAEAGMGLVCDPYEQDFTEKIFGYYKEIEFNTLYINMDRELEKVLQEYQAGIDVIKKNLS